MHPCWCTCLHSNSHTDISTSLLAASIPVGTSVFTPTRMCSRHSWLAGRHIRYVVICLCFQTPTRMPSLHYRCFLNSSLSNTLRALLSLLCTLFWFSLLSNFLFSSHESVGFAGQNRAVERNDARAGQQRVWRVATAHRRDGRERVLQIARRPVCRHG